MPGPTSNAASSSPRRTIPASRVHGTWRPLTNQMDGAFAGSVRMSSLGSYLRREREQRQISLAELAQTTRIPIRILEQLESDDHARLPADVFVRGFLRSYARVLGVDE